MAFTFNLTPTFAIHTPLADLSSSYLYLGTSFGKVYRLGPFSGEGPDGPTRPKSSVLGAKATSYTSYLTGWGTRGEVARAFVMALSSSGREEGFPACMPSCCPSCYPDLFASTSRSAHSPLESVRRLVASGRHVIALTGEGITAYKGWGERAEAPTKLDKSDLLKQGHGNAKLLDVAVLSRDRCVRKRQWGREIGRCVCFPGERRPCGSRLKLGQPLVVGLSTFSLMPIPPLPTTLSPSVSPHPHPTGCWC